MLFMECVFCKIIKKEIPSEIVDESNSFIAIRDIHPKSPGHTLIIPKKHYVTLIDLPNKLGEELLSFTKHVATGLLEDKYGDAFNLIMNNLPAAGQIVMHAHLHIIPRKEKDGLHSLA